MWNLNALYGHVFYDILVGLITSCVAPRTLPHFSKGNDKFLWIFKQFINLFDKNYIFNFGFFASRASTLRIILSEYSSASFKLDSPVNASTPSILKLPSPEVVSTTILFFTASFCFINRFTFIGGNNYHRYSPRPCQNKFVGRTDCWPNLLSGCSCWSMWFRT